MATRNWDPRKVFDVSPEERKAIEERARVRESLKAEWQKKITSPHRGTGGFIFDPAMQRFFSTRSGGWQYFKATPYTAALSFSLVIAPMVLMYYTAKNSWVKRENEIRSGKVAYKDRENRFLN